MSKALVTGGAGFLGSHLVDRLLKDGHEVLVIDHFSQGKLENLPKNHRLEAWQTDIMEDIDYLFDGVDAVFHLAALTRPRESMKNPKETHKVNVEGTRNVLNACKKSKVKKVVFVSSAATYGTKTRFPTNENDEQNPESPYADSKVKGEELCKMFEEAHGLKINIVRPFNVYGDRQNPEGPYGAAVPKFIEALREGKKPFITGDGKQFRDFVYIDDLVDLLVLASESKVSGEAFNGGSGKKTSVNELYEIISKIMFKHVKPTKAKRVDEPMTQADISKAKKMLGWEPKFSLEEGLKEII